MPIRGSLRRHSFPIIIQLAKSSFKVLSCGGVHGLVGLDAVLHRDRRVSMTKELGSKQRALRVVDHSRDGAAESVRRDVLDPGLVHVAQKTADVVGTAARVGDI